jgi:hypothetical protein
MQARAAGYALTYVTTLKQQFQQPPSSILLHYPCMASTCPIPHTFTFTLFMISSACVLHNLVM